MCSKDGGATVGIRTEYPRPLHRSRGRGTERNGLAALLIFVCRCDLAVYVSSLAVQLKLS